jgi:hypothetical protein
LFMLSFVILIFIQSIVLSILSQPLFLILIVVLPITYHKSTFRQVL